MFLCLPSCLARWYVQNYDTYAPLAPLLRQIEVKKGNSQPPSDARMLRSFCIPRRRSYDAD